MASGFREKIHKITNLNIGHKIETRTLGDSPNETFANTWFIVSAIKKHI